MMTESVFWQYFSCSDILFGNAYISLFNGEIESTNLYMCETMPTHTKFTVKTVGIDVPKKLLKYRPRFQLLIGSKIYLDYVVINKKTVLDIEPLQIVGGQKFQFTGSLMLPLKSPKLFNVCVCLDGINERPIQ